jgi:hypothetical protein
MPDGLGQPILENNDYPEEEIVFEDVIGGDVDGKEVAAGGPGVFSGGAISSSLGGAVIERFYHSNIDDPAYTLQKWRQEPLNLIMPGIEPEKKTCEQECTEKMAERRKRCNEVRKRVALALKEAGCPSKVTGYAKKSKCPSRTSYKKKTLVCKRK